MGDLMPPSFKWFFKMVSFYWESHMNKKNVKKFALWKSHNLMYHWICWEQFDGSFIEDRFVQCVGI